MGSIWALMLNLIYNLLYTQSNGEMLSIKARFSNFPEIVFLNSKLGFLVTVDIC